jgi:hypothetical protein
MAYEKFDPDTGQQYTWSQGESLADLAKPERIQQIKAEFAAEQARDDQGDGSSNLIEVLSNAGLI